MITEQTYNVGIYCRLSNDEEHEGESFSIENQKSLLKKYVQECTDREERLDVLLSQIYKAEQDIANIHISVPESSLNYLVFLFVHF